MRHILLEGCTTHSVLLIDRLDERYLSWAMYLAFRPVNRQTTPDISKKDDVPYFPACYLTNYIKDILNDRYTSPSDLLIDSLYERKPTQTMNLIFRPLKRHTI